MTRKKYWKDLKYLLRKLHDYKKRYREGKGFDNAHKRVGIAQDIKETYHQIVDLVMHYHYHI